MADLDAAIRAALDDTQHGDRPDGGMCHADCCGQLCGCGLNERPKAALVAVLDRCNAINSMMVASEVRCLIAEALGVPQAGDHG